MLFKIINSTSTNHIFLKEWCYMKFKNCLCTLMVGAMMAFTYEQIKNGNMKKMISKCLKIQKI